MHRFPRTLVFLCVFPLCALGATPDRSAQARLAMQRLACSQALGDLGEAPALEAALVEGGRLLADNEPVAPILEAILFAEDGFKLKPREAAAFRNWRTMHGPEREWAIKTATPFWVRNAVAFITKAECWSGLQKAVVFHALASRIVALNTLRDLDRGPMWSFRVFRTLDRAFVFHGPRHRLFIADRSSPGALVRSERMEESMLQRVIWPQETAGTLEKYYRSISAFQPLRPTRAAVDYGFSTILLLSPEGERSPDAALPYLSLEAILRAFDEAERAEREERQARLLAALTSVDLARFVARMLQEPDGESAPSGFTRRIGEQGSAPVPPAEPPSRKSWSRLLFEAFRDTLLGSFWRRR